MADDGEEKQYTPGWYGTLQQAADAATQEEGIDFDQTYEVTFKARKKNPLHEYKANLRPAD